MKLSIEVSRDDIKLEQGRAHVGWFLTEEKGAVLFEAAERLQPAKLLSERICD